MSRMTSKCLKAMQNAAKLPTFRARWFRLLPCSCDSHMHLQLTRRWCEVMHVDRHDIQLEFRGIRSLFWKHFAQLAEYSSVLSIIYTSRRSLSLWAQCRRQHRVAGDLVLGHVNPLKLWVADNWFKLHQTARGSTAVWCCFQNSELRSSSKSCAASSAWAWGSFCWCRVPEEWQKLHPASSGRISWIILNHCRILSHHHHNHHTHHHTVNNGLSRYIQRRNR